MKDLELYGGIDQCNKGEALGPIIVALCYTDNKEVLQKYFGESKSCTKFVYNNLMQILKQNRIKYKIVTIGTTLIDQYNLNDLIFYAQKSLLKKINLKKCSIDSHYSDSSKLKRRHNLEKGKLTCACRLDSVDPLVGLASIVCRKYKQFWLKKVEKKYSYQLGSGNLRDPLTIKHIKKYYPDVPFLRKKWSLKSIIK